MDKQYTIEQLEEMSPNELGRILLYRASGNPVNIQCLKNLINAGAYMEARNADGWTALHYYVCREWIEGVKVLINGGAFIDAKTNVGRTSLYYAAQYGHTEVVKILLGAGASKEALDNNGRTPWDTAKPQVKKAVPELNPNA